MLDSQNFTVSGKTVKDGAKGASEHVRRAGTAATSHETKILANDVVGSVRPHPQEDPQDKKIQGLRKFQSRADMLWNAEMFGMFGGMGVGWVAKKTKSDKFMAGVKAVFTAPFETLRETRLNNLHQLPANYMRKVSEYSGAVGGKATEWATAAENKAVALEASGERLAARVETHAGPVANQVKDGVRNGLNAFEGTGAGKQTVGGIQKFAKWRADTNTAKHFTHLGKAEQALTQKPPHSMFGFVTRIKNYFTGGSLESLPAHEGLSEVTTHLTNARSAVNSAERLAHMESAEKVAKGIAANAEGDLAKRAGHVLKYIQKSTGAANAAHHMEAASTQGLTGLVKAAGKAVGRVPVFGAVIGLGVAAGLTATVMTHTKESKTAKQAHAEIAAAIGGNNALMQSIEKAYHKGKTTSLAKSGLSMVSDLANGAMAASPTAGGMGYMAAAMLPMGASALIKENPLLNAYANLRAEETKGVTLPPEAKLMLLRQLVGSVPSVMAHGGIYNRLTEPVAEAIMDQKLSAKETMQLLANETQFSQLATDVLEKQKAAAAAVAANAPKAGIANDNSAKAPLLNGKPTVSGIVSEGRVAQAQKVAAV